MAAALLFIAPALSAQTAKQLVAGACDNEMQQRKHDTLWASQIQRHEGGHIYLEREIATRTAVP